MTAQERLAAALAKYENRWHEITSAEEAVNALTADPTLAEDIEFGQAWREAEAALPEGRILRLDYIADDPDDPFEEGDLQYSAHASRSPNKPWLVVEGPTPTAALIALRDALLEGSDK